LQKKTQHCYFLFLFSDISLWEETEGDQSDDDNRKDESMPPDESDADERRITMHYFSLFIKFRQKSIFSSRWPLFVILSVFHQKRNPSEPTNGQTKISVNIPQGASNRCVTFQSQRSKSRVYVKVAQSSGQVLITRRTAAYHVGTRPASSLVANATRISSISNQTSISLVVTDLSHTQK